ncbi:MULTISPECIES: hypothetical protein [Achromobacter]|uniref:Lipoprotein n=1 Tax=Achromobacter veterisilvae TaxID=2069367 RepID=A0A446CFH1_9BURK|nr:hypothetical protein [Achromobacter veterisilvae]SSW66634.1 hypothetical protein AVE30378_02173 [Achromobacter veterisilvae]
MKAILIIALAMAVAGCTDAQNAHRLLTNSGYSDIQITGYRWFGCSEDDTVRTGFTAKGPGGAHVSGIVCQGWGWFTKAATIRFE